MGGNSGVRRRPVRSRPTFAAARAAWSARRAAPVDRRHAGTLPVTIAVLPLPDRCPMITSARPLADTEVHGWLAVGRAGSCNGHTVLRAVEAFGAIGGLFEAGDRELGNLGFRRAAAAGLRRVDWDAVRRDRDTLRRLGASIVPIGTSAYPARLAAIASPPPVLYCRGDPLLLDRAQIAIVGARAATRGGRERARALARDLAACGLVVTSGLALGIDAAAHRGALDAAAPSVAVLATGAERIYPKSNAGLARELLESGALVTERAPGTPPLPGNFPRRNRLISGLGLGVLVVEASLRSGSLITARLAADEGREVFAVPGSVDSALSRGCHALLRDGAKLVESVVDVLDEIAHVARPAGPPIRSKPGAHDDPAAGGHLDESERIVVDALGHDPAGIDQLVDNTGLTAGRLASILLTLEIDGRIEALPGGRYVRTSGRRA